MMKKALFMLAMLTCILAGCSGGGNDEPINPTPKPEEVKAEITLDSSIVSNGLSFGVASGEQIVSFSANTNWTLSVASTTSGATWCKASATSGSKGNATVKFTIDENTSYDDRSVSVTIKAGTASKTFTITQKGADALLVTTNKYEVAQEGGKIEVEVKANINYELAISETAKDWITESKSRALTTHKHTFEIALNEDSEKREGEITFKSGDKVEIVKVYQVGGAIILLSQNEFTVSDAGETISVDIKSNVEYGVQMPDVDWITNEASSRGMSSHTLKYVISPNEGYDARSAEIIFYDKNSDLKDTLKVVQAQKDAIVISKKTYDVKAEGETIEVKLSANVDFEITMPEVDWIEQVNSRALTEHLLYFKVSENASDEDRKAEITFTNKDSQLNESIVINQKCPKQAGYENGVVTISKAGTMKKLLGDDYLNITSLKVVGSINGDDIYYLAKMLGRKDFSEADWGKLTTLDLSDATIIEGGGWYTNRFGENYTTDNVIGDHMFRECANLQNIVLPNNLTSIGLQAFEDCAALKSIVIPDGVTSIGNSAFSCCKALTSISIPASVNSIINAFDECPSLKSVYITDIAAWCNIDFGHMWSYGPFKEDSEMYLNNQLLTELIIPEGVKEIKDFAFCNLKSITKVIIPNSVTSIGEYAFHECDKLTSIEIPNSVTSLGEYIFCDCDALTSVVIGDGVKTIPYQAFYDCDSLATVVLGKDIEDIAGTVFIGCSAIIEFYCYATTPPSIKREFTYGYENSGSSIWSTDVGEATLYVPARCGAAYKTSAWGGVFKNIKEMD